MTPKEIISEFSAAINLNGDDVFVLSQIKEILLPGLQQYPNNEELMFETALAFDSLLGNQEMAIMFYEKIKSDTRVEYLVNYSRCLAQTGEKDRALDIIDNSSLASHEDVVEIRKDIESDLWD